MSTMNDISFAVVADLVVALAEANFTNREIEDITEALESDSGRLDTLRSWAHGWDTIPVVTWDFDSLQLVVGQALAGELPVEIELDHVMRDLQEDILGFIATLNPRQAYILYASHQMKVGEVAHAVDRMKATVQATRSRIYEKLKEAILYYEWRWRTEAAGDELLNKQLGYLINPSKANILAEHAIVTVRDAVFANPSRLNGHSIVNLGMNGMSELQSVLNARGLMLKPVEGIPTM